MLILIIYICLCSVYSYWFIERELKEDLEFHKNRGKLVISFFIIVIFAPLVLLEDIYMYFKLKEDE